MVVVSLLMDLLPAMGDKDTMNKIAVLVFTIFFGSFIVIGTHSVDKINRVLFLCDDCCFYLSARINATEHQI